MDSSLLVLPACFLFLLNVSVLAENPGTVTIPYCSTYLCPRFPKSITAYFKSGCEGDFRAYLLAGTSIRDTVKVHPWSLLVLVGGSVVIGLTGGYFVGKRIKQQGRL